MPWELTFLEWVQNNLTCGFLSQILRVITITCDVGLIWILLALFLIGIKKSRKCGLCMLVTLVIVALISNNLIFKPSVARVRPFLVDSNLTMAENWFLPPKTSLLGVGEIPMEYSFMSGHTVASFAGATTLFIYNKKAGIVGYIYALIVAWSRLYFGVHYPTDVIAGIIWGVGGSIGIYYAYAAVYKVILRHKKSLI